MRQPYAFAAAQPITPGIEPDCREIQRLRVDLQLTVTFGFERENCIHQGVRRRKVDFLDGFVFAGCTLEQIPSLYDTGDVRLGRLANVYGFCGGNVADEKYDVGKRVGLAIDRRFALH